MTAHAYVSQGKRRVVLWTPDREALLGTMPDMALAKKMGLPPNKNGEGRVAKRRKKLGIPAFRESLIRHRVVNCGNCGKELRRKLHSIRRVQTPYCSKECGSAGQKTRDEDRLRYGPGWKNRRAEIRRRDKTCRVCGKTPEENGAALHVHHLKPFRFGGTNLNANLVGLCDSCHHRIEFLTTQVLASIQIAVVLEGTRLTISVEGTPRWDGDVLTVAG